MKVRVLFSTLLVIMLLSSTLAPLAAAQEPSTALGNKEEVKQPSLDELEKMHDRGQITKEEYLQAVEELGQPESCSPDAIWPGPDGFGYVGQTVTYNWVDISGTGTAVYLDCDDCNQGPFPIGFTFPFYGVNYTEFYIESNGLIEFGPVANDYSSDCPLPNANGAENFLAPHWDDLNAGNNNAPVYYEHFPACPYGSGECMVVEYYDFYHLDGAWAGTWEAIFYPNGDVVYQYFDIGPQLGQYSTTGIEGLDIAGDHGLTYACNAQGSIYAGLAIWLGVWQGPIFGDSEKMAPAKIEWLEPLNYTVVIRNTGDAPGLATVMTDVLPVGTEFIAGSLTCDSGTCWYDDVDNAVYWSGEVLPSARAELKGWQPEAPVAPERDYDPAAVADLVGDVEPAAPPAPEGTSAIWASPEAVLWDNGPLVTHPGDCSGMDASRLQTSLGMNTLGFGHQVVYGYRMADDFDIADPDGWNIDQITFFAYQTNAPADPSPIAGVYYQIWDGPPDDPASSVVFGDLTTNRLLSSASPNLQRDSETSPCANNRYIFADVASAGLWLAPGTYWLDWMTDGSPSYSGPWAPPITILGQTTTGNALQYTDAWAPALDSGTGTPQQGMPFIIEGTVASNEVVVEFAVDTPGVACGDTIVNEAVIYDPEAPGPAVVAAGTSVVGPLYYMEDFEADDGGYGGTGEWEWGVPTYGPPNAHSGMNVWGTDLDDDYENSVDWVLTKTLDLPVDPNGLWLQWWEWYDIESCCDDGWVEINGDTLHNVYGTSGDWVHSMADISAYAGQTVTVTFRFESDSSIVHAGWYIDDVAIHGACIGPDITVDPPSLHSDQCPDEQVTLDLSICNAGDSWLDWNVIEMTPTLKMGYVPALAAGVVPEPNTRERTESYDPEAVTTAGILSPGGSEPMNVLGAGDVLVQWPTGDILNWGDGFSLIDGMVWINDNAAGGGSGLNEEFDVAGNRTGRNFTPNFGGSWPGDMAFNPNTGMFWQVNVGGDNCIYEWDPAIPGATGNSICGAPWSGISQRGLAYDPTDDTFFIGGWNEDIIYHIQGETGPNPGEVIEQWPVGLQIAGLAHNFEAGQLFVIENSATDTISQFDVVSGIVVNSFTVSGFGNYVGAGLAIDCDGNLWAVNQGDNNAYLVDSGVPANLCAPAFDAPWLTEVPTQGLVFPGECMTVEVTFDSSGLEPGDYAADLIFRSNDPDEPAVIVPVSMTVLVPAQILDVTYVVTDLEVAFDATVTGAEPIAYEWDFGDGDTSSEEDPVHVYDEGGCYTVMLTASNCAQDTWSEEICLCAEVEAMTLSMLTPYPIYMGDLVEFEADIMPDNFTAPLSYTIDYGDGSVPDEGLNWADPMPFSHTFVASGTMKVQVEIWNCGMEVPISDWMDVEMMQPIFYVYLPIVVKDSE